MVDDRKKKAARAINEELEKYESDLSKIIELNSTNPNFVPDTAFNLFKNGGVIENSGLEEPDTILKATQYYIDMNRSLKGYTNATERTYVNIVEKIVPGFLQSMKVNDIYLRDFKTRVAKAFKGYLNQSGFKPKTQSLYISFMKSVFKMIMEDFPADEFPHIGLVSNPFAIRSVKVHNVGGKNIEGFLHPNTEAKAWELFDSGWKPLGKDRYHDYLGMALLMWNTGLSFADTCNSFSKSLELGSSEPTFRYRRRKTGTDARVLFYPELHKILEIIQNKEDEYLAKYNNWLPVKYFLDDGKDDILLKVYEPEYQKFYDYLKKYLSKELGEVKITPHMLRHSFAVKMLHKGHSMDAVKTMMAHKTIVTTEEHYGYILDAKLINEKRINERNQSNLRAM